jgi:E3 ubiquitin-protein ligase RNF38/44
MYSDRNAFRSTLFVPSRSAPIGSLRAAIFTRVPLCSRRVCSCPCRVVSLARRRTARSRSPTPRAPVPAARRRCGFAPPPPPLPLSAHAGHRSRSRSRSPAPAPVGAAGAAAEAGHAPAGDAKHAAAMRHPPAGADDALGRACPLCLEPCAAGGADGVAQYGCGHMAHKACLWPWLARSPTCPECRATWLLPSAWTRMMLDCLAHGDPALPENEARVASLVDYASAQKWDLRPKGASCATFLHLAAMRARWPVCPACSVCPYCNMHSRLSGASRADGGAAAGRRLPPGRAGQRLRRGRHAARLPGAPLPGRVR